AVRMRCRAGRVLAALRHWREVLDEKERQRVLRAEHRGLPAEFRVALLAPAVDEVAYVHAARSHRGDVCRQVVALHDDVADATARRYERGPVAAEPPRRRLGCPVLFWIADRQQLEVVLVVECDRVVSALAGMHAARL